MECTRDFDAAERASRGESITPAPTLNLEDIERDILAELLAGDDEARADGDARRQHQTPEEREQWPNLSPVAFGQKGGMGQAGHVAYGMQIEMLAEDYRVALSQADPDVVEAECKMLLRKRGVTIDPTSDDYYQLGLAVLRGHVQTHDLMLKRHKGAIVTTPSPSSGKGPRVSEAYDAWKAGSDAKGSRKISERTLQEADHAVRRLIEWCGDVPLGALSRDVKRRSKLARRITDV